MKTNPKLLILIFFITFCFSTSLGQIRGKELYDKLKTDKSLIKFEGLSSINWTPDGNAYYIFEDGTFKKIDPETGEENCLFDDSRIISAYNKLTGENIDKLPFTTETFSFIDDSRKIKFTRLGKAFVYDFKTNKIISFTSKKSFKGVRGRVYSEVFSPDFKYRTYIKDYNLYIKDLKNNETPLTVNGNEDLRNGFPDWVYPEELDQYDAFWWSPDSRKIAYMQFDESPVTKYPIVYDSSPDAYVEMQSYPRAGSKNPVVKFFIVDIGSKKTIQIDTGDETDVYLMRGQWSADGKKFLYQRLNRQQDVLELFSTDPNTGESKLLLKDEEECYINLNFDLKILKNKNQFIWTSERTGYKEIYLYDLSGNLLRQLTDAKLPVEKILDIDEKEEWVYFTGYENRGLETHLYRVKLDGTNFTKLTEEKGSHSVRLSPGCKYFVDTFSSFDKPKTVCLYRSDGKFLRQPGKTIVSKEFKDLKLIKPEHLLFKSADKREIFDGIVYKPADFDEDKKYPLILSVYGGPASKRIFNRFNLNDSNQILAQLGFIVFTVDHRGVSRRGKNFETLMYMKLGQIEIEDHVSAVKFISSRKYIDKNRVGIFGHSYGGYLTCMALLKKPDIFYVGVAGAPVTDWRNYDTIYTERFMRRPQDNGYGYDISSCMKYAENLKGHLFIHHGTIDNNVHPGNTIQLVNELLKNNKKFDLMFYPDQKHRISTNRYEESRIEYFLKHLKPEN